MKSRVLKGLSISKGIAIGAPFFPLQPLGEIIPEYSLQEGEVEEEIKDVGECSSSMSYGHQQQHFQHHDVNVSNNRY